MNATVKIDMAKKTATITVPLDDTLPVSGSGATQSLVSIRNEAIGVAHTDGRPIKMTLQLYVKVPGWVKPKE